MAHFDSKTKLNIKANGCAIYTKYISTINKETDCSLPHKTVELMPELINVFGWGERDG